MLRFVWAAYTLTLLTATHWPGLAIRGPVSRMDLIVHMGAFGLWGVLLYGAGLFREGPHRVTRIAIATACFGVLDETTQPFFSRVFDPTDLGADMLGGVLAGVVVSVWIWVTRGRTAAVS